MALSCPNLPHFPAIYYGILKTGAVVVPLNVLLKGREVAYHLEDSDAKAYVCFEGTPSSRWVRRAGPVTTRPSATFFLVTATPGADSPIDGAETLGAALADQPSTFETAVTEATDTAVILYTSGTTGQPKGAELSHSNLLLNALTCNRQFGVAEHEVHLITLPLFHSFGSTADERRFRRRRDAGPAAEVRRREGSCIAAEGEGHLLRRRADDVLGTARRPHRRRRRRPDRVEPAHRSLRCGASLPVEIIRQFKDRFHVQILEGYGLSETSPLATFADRSRAATRLDRRADLGRRVPAR